MRFRSTLLCVLLWLAAATALAQPVLQGPGGGEVTQILYLGADDAEFLGTGASLSRGFDFEGDSDDNGEIDFLIGAPFGLGDVDVPGRAFLILGNVAESSEVSLPSPPTGVISIVSGSDEADRLGISVASAGDVDNDGRDDILIGAPGRTGGLEGKTYLIFGTDDLPKAVDLSTHLAVGRGVVFSSTATAKNEDVGLSVAGIGDVNDDGFDDFAIGAPKTTTLVGNLSVETGKVYVVFGGDHLRDVASIDLGSLAPPRGWGLAGVGSLALFGTAVGALGDIDRDGNDDFAIGAPGALSPGQEPAPRTGAAYIVFGSTTIDSGPPDLFGDEKPPLVVTVRGPAAGARFGHSLAGERDVNGDGGLDLLVGAPGVELQGDEAVRGAAALLRGSPSVRDQAEIDLSKDLDDAHIFAGAQGDAVGTSVDLVPDTNGDDVDDLLFGAPGTPEQPGGKAYLVHGGDTLPADTLFLETLTEMQGTTVTTTQEGTLLGQAVVGLDDRDGDGLGDIALGAPLFDTTKKGRKGPAMPPGGAVFEVLGIQGPQAPQVPRDLTCTLLPGKRVRLTWVLDQEYDGIVVQRDGESIAKKLPGDTTYFVDVLDPATPIGTTFSYTVRTSGPDATSAPCEVEIVALPVENLRCVQIASTTDVRVTWELADGYSALRITVDGVPEAPDLPGDVVEVVITDVDAGDTVIEVFDPANPAAALRASCSLEVLAVPSDPVANFTCQHSDNPSSVQLQWMRDADFTGYELSRDGVVIAVLGQVGTFPDSGPPPGNRTYTLRGLVEGVHKAPAATCSVVIPDADPGALEGRVFFVDPQETPIASGTVKLLDAAGGLLETVQPDLDGRFFYSVAPRVPATAVYSRDLPDVDAPPQDTDLSLTVEVKVPAAGAGALEIVVPVPVAAVSVSGEGPMRWDALRTAAESFVDAQGLQVGTLVFPLDVRADLFDTTTELAAHVDALRNHIAIYLGAAPGAIDLIAHGAAGLSARAYLQSSLPGDLAVRKLVLLGTPNLGTLFSIPEQRLRVLDPKFGKVVDDKDPAEQVEQSKEYLDVFNQQFKGKFGVDVHLVAGIGGSDLLDAILECAEHDGRVCSASALGGIPAAATDVVADDHEQLGQSAASVALLVEDILRTPARRKQREKGDANGGADGDPNGQRKGPAASTLDQGPSIFGILPNGSSAPVHLFSDTTGSITLLLANRLPVLLEFEIETPEGETITPGTVEGIAGVEFVSYEDGEGNVVQLYSFANGSVGTYTANLANSDAALDAIYTLQMYADSPLELDVDLSESQIDVGDTVVITAALSEQANPVRGATVEALILDPTSLAQYESLLDDGTGGDQAAGDGIYTGTFADTSDGGVYFITVNASGDMPSMFVLEETAFLVVFSDAAVVDTAAGITSDVEDLDNDGVPDVLVVEGSVDVAEAGSYVVIGTLADANGDPVAVASTLIDAAGPGTEPFQLEFDGLEILASQQSGPYTLADLQVIDAELTFLQSDSQENSHTTQDYPLVLWLPPPELFRRADSNGDGTVDIADAVMNLFHQFVAPMSSCEEALDVEDDGTLTPTDAVRILELLFLDGPAPPPPFEACGEDEDADGLECAEGPEGC